MHSEHTGLEPQIKP